MVFLNLEAVDNVSRGKMWNIVNNKGYPLHLIAAMKSMYEKTAVVLDLNGKITAPIITNRRLRHGCSMAQLFSIHT